MIGVIVFIVILAFLAAIAWVVGRLLANGRPFHYPNAPGNEEPPPSTFVAARRRLWKP